MTAQYIAWLNGTSVARGSAQDVRDRAIAIFNTERWQEMVTQRGKPTELRITKGARQSLVSREQLVPSMPSVQDDPECDSCGQLASRHSHGADDFSHCPSKRG